MTEVQLLETVVADITNHQAGQDIDEQEQGNVLVGCPFPAKEVVHQDRGRHHRRGRRDRQANEALFIDDLDLDVKPRQAQGPADHIE